MTHTDGAGAIALVGSGEYTPAMRETDRHLLGTVSGAARVALIPTASALEPGQPQRWNGMGVAHFAELGAETSPVMLLDRGDADDPGLAGELARCRFYYFSGGSPEYLAETLDGTAAWRAVAAGHAGGAAVAGCSAGAMMLGAAFLRVREMRSGGLPRWRHGLGLAAGVAVLPHFDRIRLYLPDDMLGSALEAAPAGLTVLGIDEDTALVRGPLAGGAAARWQVMGRGTVTVFARGDAAVYRPGDHIALG